LDYTETATVTDLLKWFTFENSIIWVVTVASIDYAFFASPPTPSPNNNREWCEEVVQLRRVLTARMDELRTAASDLELLTRENQVARPFFSLLFSCCAVERKLFLGLLLICSPEKKKTFTHHCQQPPQQPTHYHC